MMKKFKIFLLLSTLYFLFSYPLSTFAAILYLEPSKGGYYQEDTFIVDVRIDTEDECINTVEANLIFPQETLEAVDFSQGNSILTLWIKNPEIRQDLREISFIGGIPGGFCGILPGDPGKSNLLGKIIFKVKNQKLEFAEVKFLDNSQVLLNDSLGTPAKLTTKGANFTILAGIPKVAKREWQQELEKDKTPPEPFEVEISQDPSIFEGKYFIIFFTTDKQTGTDYYEVKEGKKDWQRAESPYLLQDQKLQSTIKVKAVDKAGNERIIEVAPPNKSSNLVYLILILIIFIVGYWLVKNKINEKIFISRSNNNFSRF